MVPTVFCNGVSDSASCQIWSPLVYFVNTVVFAVQYAHYATLWIISSLKGLFIIQGIVITSIWLSDINATVICNNTIIMAGTNDSIWLLCATLNVLSGIFFLQKIKQKIKKEIKKMRRHFCFCYFCICYETMSNCSQNCWIIVFTQGYEHLPDLCGLS